MAQDAFELIEWYDDMGENGSNRDLIMKLGNGNRYLSE
jgi:hypothetical protein